MKRAAEEVVLPSEQEAPSVETIAEAKRLLESPDLLERVELLIERRGLQGEEMNRRLVFLAGVGGHLGDPIHLIVKGESSGGKQALVTKALEPIPPERILRVAGLSEQALAYHEGAIEGVLFIEEAEGQQHAEYSLRVAMSDGRVARLIGDRPAELTEVHGEKRHWKQQSWNISRKRSSL